MATLPRATTRVEDTAGAVASGVDTICVWAPVPQAADLVPRQFGSASAVLDVHGYSEGAEYVALHARDTRRPILFVGLPIDVEGDVGREDTSGNSGTCVTTLVPGSSGVLTEHEGVLTVLAGGTIGADQIMLGLSLDGGRTEKRVRLGTETFYTIPYVGLGIAFASGSLIAGDVIHTWHATGPRASRADFQAARESLAERLTGFRSILLVGDVVAKDDAAEFVTQLNAYETANERFVYGRVSVYDRLPRAVLSATHHSMRGAPSLTFTASGDTIARASGSWLADGFAVGDEIVVSGTSDNNGTYTIANVTSSTITVAQNALVDETTVLASIVGQPALTFSNTGETITRSRGSWVVDGFRAGDSVSITGTDSATNDGTFTISTVTPLVLTLAAGGVDADEVIGVNDVSITAGPTKAEWMAEIADAFEDVDAAFRIDLSAGRGRVSSPLTGWRFRRPASWAASIREYQHDLHVATWRKADGPVGFDLFDASGNLVEWDDRVDGEAGSAARFTVFRTWANGPRGAFIAQSLTREVAGSLLTLTHNVSVVNLACTVTQLNTENAVGRSLELNDDGVTATASSLSTIQTEVNAALELALLQNRGEGRRASRAVWTPSSDDRFDVPEPVLTGVLDLVINGTVHSVFTRVRVGAGAGG